MRIVCRERSQVDVSRFSALNLPDLLTITQIVALPLVYYS